MDWYCLKNDTKSFIVIAEPSPGLHCGDRLRLKYPGSEDILERWVKYAESGIHGESGQGAACFSWQGNGRLSRSGSIPTGNEVAI